MPWLDTFSSERIVLDLLQCSVRRTLYSNPCINRRPMPGSFVSLYKYIVNALPLLYQPIESQPFVDDDDEDVELGPPRPVGKRVRKFRLSAGGRARHEWTRKRTRAWFSIVAGAFAGGVAIMFERQSRRTVLGQQMFVRSVKSTMTFTV